MTQHAQLDDFRQAILRGLGFFAAAGLLLGGLAGTVTWPLVGTFFGAIEGAAVGAAVGLLDAILLTAVTRVTRSRWPQLVTSGLISATFAILGVSLYRGPIVVPTVLTVLLVLASVIVGTWCGPLIGLGVDETSLAARSTSDKAALARRLIGWGAAIGGGFGAIAGFIIGLASHWPTSPFAAVEGSVFGTVAGTVLACLVTAIAIIPRLRSKA